MFTHFIMIFLRCVIQILIAFVFVGSSSAAASSPLILRLSVDPSDSFWTIVCRIQLVDHQAEADLLPYETIVRALHKDKDDSIDRRAGHQSRE
jgi:hypothetical protein